MKIGEYDFPEYLIKFCEKEEFIDQLLNGKLYMKESGYFRKLEDGYRGDPYDGKMPVDLGDTEVYIETEDGERLYLNGVPGVKTSVMTMGFVGDDKFPIFCACIMNERLVEVTGPSSFRIKKEYLDEMAQFGKYVLLIPVAEMISKLDEYGQKHPEIGFVADLVRYTQIMKEYQPGDFEDEEQKNELAHFFVKDDSYCLQNEWRLVAYSQQVLIDKEKDFWICDLGPFQYALKMDLEFLLNGEFHIGVEQ